MKARSQVTKVKEYGDILWNNLPYTGLYTESAYAGRTFKNFDLPRSTKMTLVGSPLPIVNNGADNSLQLIGFSTDTIDGPMTVDTNGRLVPYSSSLIYRVKWKTSSECIVGFYTPNYLTDVTEDQSRRSVLLINNREPSIFNGECGSFTTSYIGQLFIITNRKVTVELHIEVRAPESISFPKLELFKPLPYDLPDGCTYAYETKVSQVNRDLTFLPTRPYIKLTNEMIGFLVNTSVLLDFSPIAPPSNTLSLKNDTGLTLIDVQTKLYVVQSASGPGITPITTYYYVLNLESVIGQFPQDSGYGGVKGFDNTCNTLKFPVSTTEDKQNTRIDYTFTVSGITWTEDTFIVQSENVGETQDNRFMKYKRTGSFNPDPGSLDYNDKTKTASGEGEIVIARGNGQFEFQILLPGDIGPSATSKLVFNTLEISFV